MKELLTSLENNIRQELEVQVEVQTNLDRQLDILLRGGTEKLSALLEGAEESLVRSKKFEDDRAILIRRIADKLGKPIEDINLNSLEAALTRETSPLPQGDEEIGEILERIRESNRTVSIMVRHSLLFIDQLVSTITGKATVQKAVQALEQTVLRERAAMSAASAEG